MAGDEHGRQEGDDKVVRYERTRPEGAEGWTWRETGPRGPSWYPPVREDAVDPAGEHLELRRVGPDREPVGPVLARAGAAAGDVLVFEVLERSDEVLEAVEYLNGAAFEEIGEPPLFDVAYEVAGGTANRLYADPMWVYRPAR